MKKLLLLMVIPFFSSGEITPEIANPGKFNENLFNQITSSNYLSTISGCKVISLKMFHPPERKEYPQSDTWLCLFSVDVISNGYGPGQALPEKVYLDKKTGLWKKKKYLLSKEGTQRSLDFYGIKNLSELQPLELYNIRSVNTRGYAVVNRNIPLEEKKKGVKKKLSFCLIQNQSYFAFCGSGSMVDLIDAKEVDFTPYMLKSLETVEMGLPDKSNN